MVVVNSKPYQYPSVVVFCGKSVVVSICGSNRVQPLPCGRVAGEVSTRGRSRGRFEGITKNIVF